MKKRKGVERSVMIKAIKSGKGDLRKRLPAQSEDRFLYELLNVIDAAGGAELEIPAEVSINRHISIPLAHDAESPPIRRRGRIQFDSWAQGAAPALRDTTAGQVRRFRMEAGPVALEVVAERLQDRWDFVARVYRRGAVSSQYVLRVSRKKLLPEAQGFYHWSSQQVPHQFQLISPDTTIEFEKLRW